MNMQQLMQQAQKMQRDINKTKEEINEMKFTGNSSWVTVEMNGNKEVLSVKINYDGVIEKDDLEALEDMIKIATNKCLEEINKTTESKMGKYGSALNGLM